MRTHLDSPLAAGQAAGLGAPLDLLLVAAAGEHARVALGRQLVAHGIVLGRPHVHLLGGVRVARRGVVLLLLLLLLHCVRRRGQRRAHLLLLLLGRWRGLLVRVRVLVLRLRLRRGLLLAVLQANGRQVQRRQRHVCSRRRAAVGLAGGLAGRRVRVRGLHRGGRRVRVRRGIGARGGRLLVVRVLLLVVLVVLVVRVLLLLLLVVRRRAGGLLLVAQVGHGVVGKVRRARLVGRRVGVGVRGHRGKVVRHGRALVEGTLVEGTRGAVLPGLGRAEGARSRSSLESLRVGRRREEEGRRRPQSSDQRAATRIAARGWALLVVGSPMGMGQRAARQGCLGCAVAVAWCCRASTVDLRRARLALAFAFSRQFAVEPGASCCCRPPRRAGEHAKSRPRAAQHSTAQAAQHNTSRMRPPPKGGTHTHTRTAPHCTALHCLLCSAVLRAAIAPANPLAASSRSQRAVRRAP